MKAGDKITTKDGMKLIAITANGFSPCAGCVFNDGLGKPCALPESFEGGGYAGTTAKPRLKI